MSIAVQREQADTLAGLLPFIGPSQRSFANSLIAWGRKSFPISEGRATWTAKLIAEASARRDGKAASNQNSESAPRQIVKVGDMSGVYDLFNRAKQHLKQPGVTMACDPALGASIKVSVASARARHPGSIDVVVDSGKRDDEGRPITEWIGRVFEGGRFEVSPRLADRSVLGPVTEAVRTFAADPATGAKESARLTGRCCFCDGPLKDARSTAVGYGKTCSKRYGLVW